MLTMVQRFQGRYWIKWRKLSWVFLTQCPVTCQNPLGSLPKLARRCRQCTHACASARAPNCVRTPIHTFVYIHATIHVRTSMSALVNLHVLQNCVRARNLMILSTFVRQYQITNHLLLKNTRLTTSKQQSWLWPSKRWSSIRSSSSIDTCETH